MAREAPLQWSTETAVHFLWVLALTANSTALTTSAQPPPNDSPSPQPETPAMAADAAIPPPSSRASPAEPTSELRPLPVGTRFRPHFTTPTPDTGIAAATLEALAEGAPGKPVYRNTKGMFVLSPGPGQRVADDITTTSAPGCTLDRFAFRVSGDKENHPSNDEGPFTVEYALYEACPSSRICQPWDVDCPQLIGGTSGAITLPDEGFHEVTVLVPPRVCARGPHDGEPCSSDADCQPRCAGGIHDGQSCTSVKDCAAVCVGGDAAGSPCSRPDHCPGGTCDLDDVGTCDVEDVGVCSDGVTLPGSFYLGLSFSRASAGVVVGAPALVGVSADGFDYGFGCTSAFGGWPGGPHASFFVELYVNDDCAQAFPAYVNHLPDGKPYTPGGGRLFFDDIELGVDAEACNMIAYEVAFRGKRSDSFGAVQVTLHSRISESDPEDTGRIPGTRMQAQVFGDDVHVLRKTLSSPVPLKDHLSPGGRILFAVFKTATSDVGPIGASSLPQIGDTTNLCDSPEPIATPCYQSVDIKVYCQGEPPIGACCDVLLQEDYTCVGGSFPNTPCHRDDDCRCLTPCVDGICDTSGSFTCLGGQNAGAFCLSDAHCACPS